MARRARYLAALPVYVERDRRDWIDRQAEMERISIAQVIREIIDGDRPSFKEQSR